VDPLSRRDLTNGRPKENLHRWELASLGTAVDAHNEGSGKAVKNEKQDYLQELAHL